MAAKVRSQFVCGNCGTAYAQWMGQCGNCKQWNTLVEEVRDRVEERRGTPASLRQRDQRRGQDVGEHQVVGRLVAHQPVAQARGVHEPGSRAVQAGVLARDAHRDPIDVGAYGDR